MGKRPYYLITHLVDCDGYSTYTDYLGVNAQAAIDRFKHLAGEIKQRYFLSEGLDEEHIYYGNDQTWEEAMNLTLDKIDTPGKAYTLYMNDDNCCWIHIRLAVIAPYSSSIIPSAFSWVVEKLSRFDNRKSYMDPTTIVVVHIKRICFTRCIYFI